MFKQDFVTPTILAYAALATTAAGTGVSVVQSQAAADARREAVKKQQAMEAIRQAREKSNLLRQARIARANVNQGATNTGTEASSGLAGASSSIAAQQVAGASFLDTQASYATQISNLGLQASNADNNAALGSAAASLSTAYLGTERGQEGLHTIFDKTPLEGTAAPIPGMPNLPWLQQSKGE